MAVRDDVVLVSDGGDVTVGRRTASYVYGEFNVVLPHGREKVETEERLQDGYVYRPKGGIKGPFDVGFVRADATVDLEADTSDLEVVVDAAQKQAEGDVFFERDISQAGLGRFVLDRDFRVGDVVTVELWGKRLPLPVTAGDYVASVSEGPAAARVHVGGQLISDAEAVARQNGELRRQIAREKAERQRQVSSESLARRSAVSGERSAREAAIRAEASARRRGDEDEARNRQVALEAEERKRAADLKTIREFLGGAGASDAALLSQLAAVNAQIVGIGGGKAAPAPGLLNSYMSLNTLLWEQQQEINRINERFRLDAEERQRQDAILNARQEEALQRAQTAIDNEEKYRMWPGAGPANSEWFSPRNNPFVEVRAEGNTSTARLKRRCTGYIQLMQKMTDGRMDMWGWNVDHPAGTTFELSGGGLLKVEQFFILYQLWEP